MAHEKSGLISCLHRTLLDVKPSRCIQPADPLYTTHTFEMGSEVI
jgi:hypothetical protein